MARKPHKYHYIYKTVNQVNGKYYIGMHSTDNLNDGYIGSGKRLWYAIKKYGRENFKKVILEYLPDRSSLKDREKEIVNEDLLNDTMCMNLIIGGQGGEVDPDKFKKIQSLGGSATCKILNKRHFQKLKNNSEYKKRYSEKMSNVTTGEKNPFYGRIHSEETKKKISLSQQGKQKGKNNSQYGTMWIYNEQTKENKKIIKNNFIPEGWKKGRKYFRV